MKVSIERTGRSKNNEGWIRLRYSYQGKKQSISTGLPYSPQFLPLAQKTAAQITIDIYSGEYDSTKKKYMPLKAGRNPTAIPVIELFDRFAKQKSTEIEPLSLVKYKNVRSWVEKLLVGFTCDQITFKVATNFSQQLLKNISLSTTKEYVSLLRSCWTWAAKDFIVQRNPWKEIELPRGSGRKPKISPLEPSEIWAVLQTFSQKFPEYRDYACFQLACGTRPWESAALVWSKVSRDFSKVEISASYSRGQLRGTTKTGSDRTLILPQGIPELLKARFDRLKPKKSDLVFSVGGKPINDQKFRQVWIKALEIAGVEYRKPYGTRHTAISLALESGSNPLAVAQNAGHNLETMYSHYATSISK